MVEQMMSPLAATPVLRAQPILAVEDLRRSAMVTVIVPTYERPGLLREALQSALRQTYRDFVLLVGDNSESDDTEELIRALNDPRVHYHRNRPSIDQQSNWRDLVARAESPLVASLHDDDAWHPDFLAEAVPGMLADPSIAMTFTDFWMTDEGGRRLEKESLELSARTGRSSLRRGRLHYDRLEGLRLALIQSAPQPAYAAVFRRDDVLALDFPADIDPLYDIWISYQFVRSGLGLAYVPRRLTNYRVRPGTGNGYAEAEEAVFRHVLTENADLGSFTDELMKQVAIRRWLRATRLMAGGSRHRAESQIWLRRAVEDLRGPRRLLARGGGRSKSLWYSLLAGRRVLHRLRKLGRLPAARLSL